ncbi:hypothetical protein AALB11_09175 [Parasutterella excrementihominis]
MCSSSDSDSSDYWKDAALILGASMLLNRKQENSSEYSGSCDNPISLIIECFGMIKLVLMDPIIWAFGVVREAPSLISKIFYFFFLLLSAPAYYALAIPIAALIAGLILLMAVFTAALIGGFFFLIYIFWKIVFGAL